MTPDSTSRRTAESIRSVLEGTIADLQKQLKCPAGDAAVTLSAAVKAMTKNGFQINIKGYPVTGSVFGGD